MRVDVHFPEDRITADLARLNRRIRCLLDASREIPPRPMPLRGLPSGLQARLRAIDGETFVYVLDSRVERIVASTVLNRLVELGRRTDDGLRAPHSRVALDWRRRGITSAIYRWRLDAGHSLITGARQSPAARALWLRLARDYRLAYVRLEARRVLLLDDMPPPAELAALNVRAVLFGRGCESGPWTAADGGWHQPWRMGSVIADSGAGIRRSTTGVLR